MKRWTASGLFWVSGLAAAQSPSATPGLVHAHEILPTRMVLCQREIAMAQDADDRQGRIRACLSRRLEGERIIERNCKRDASGVSGAAARTQAQRHCERQALAVLSSELPRRPPPPPRPLAVPDGALLPTAASARRPAALPAAGEN